MDTAHDLTPAERLRLACEMHDLGVAMMRQNLCRKHPSASEEDIQRMLVEWLHDRPGAEDGDVSGPGLRVIKP